MGFSDLCASTVLLHSIKFAEIVHKIKTVVIIAKGGLFFFNLNEEICFPSQGIYAPQGASIQDPLSLIHSA